MFFKQSIIILLLQKIWIKTQFLMPKKGCIYLFNCLPFFSLIEVNFFVLKTYINQSAYFKKFIILLATAAFTTV